MDRNLNNLLKWGIENSAPSSTAAGGPNGATGVTTHSSDTTTANDTPTDPSSTATPASNLNPELLSALFGGPSEADLMRAAMAAIRDPSVDLDNKLIAFDNFEQMIESLDNANNLEPLALWAPLIELLAHDERELRRMAAWCVGTAVQNNATSQARFLAHGGVPPLVGLATREGEDEAVRRKAVYALSSAVRNHQPAMDAAAEELKKAGHEHGKGDQLDASDMDAVDGVIDWLKEKAKGAKA
ncbi:hypothetical protein C8A00DRAFT_38507 [Chaetomidium leptoderma]|uniref:Nucleotide exchange factor Fes1 domain-containing protein n=1 Tax=Chaetomidium leptoderma TaxID=669021 RepID=A0AAN6VEY7_9PEZI|nr:hypothetical protein C8A00DRAFT_38507 [Chaetomidium leptoderma]